MLAPPAPEDREAVPGAREQAARALEAADWERARRCSRLALLEEDTPQAREGLGLALWFLGEVAAGIAERERAFEQYLAAGRRDDAARTGVWVAHQHMLAGRASAARGWLRRAERALDGVAPGSPGHGWVAVERARHAEDVHEQVRQARIALDVAGQAHDGDLEVFSLSLLGRATVEAGRRQEGLALLEEAMAAATAGRARDVHTLGQAYCALIDGCVAAGDWELGAEWCRTVEGYAREHRAAPLTGACQALHADVLVALGDWPAAEQALRSSLAVQAGHVPQAAGPARAALAELAVCQGRVGEAEALLAGHEHDAASGRALARLRLAEDRPEEAVAILDRCLRAAGDHPVRQAHLLGAHVEALLACGDAPAAGRAAARLQTLAGTTDVRLVAATSDLARARVALAARPVDAAGAAERAGRALEAFGLLAMPYPSALARLELARALVAARPAAAREEARAARAAFRGLGAVRPADQAAALLRALGDVTGPRQRSGDDLTRREHEVLELLAVGMSNARIASALVISEKTAGHHVSHILAKLGASNRTEAVAHASRAPDGGLRVRPRHPVPPARA